MCKEPVGKTPPERYPVDLGLPLSPSETRDPLVSPSCILGCRNIENPFSVVCSVSSSGLSFRSNG